MQMYKTATILVACCIICCRSALAQEEPPEYERLNSGIQIEELTGQLPGAAKDNIKPMPILQVALDLIKIFEGWSSKAYDDPAGYCTIGYGHLIAKALCSSLELGRFATPMTKSDGNLLLADDTRSARLTIQGLVKTDLSKQQFGALTSFVFNVGGTNFAKSTMLRLLNDEEYALAARELRKWTRANKKVLKGLVIRRNCEFALFNGDKMARLSNGQINIDDCGRMVGAAPNVEETIDILTGEAGD